MHVLAGLTFPYSYIYMDIKHIYDSQMKFRTDNKCWKNQKKILQRSKNQMENIMQSSSIQDKDLVVIVAHRLTKITMRCRQKKSI